MTSAVSTRTRVGVIRGGPSSEHAVSLQSAAGIKRGLQDRYQVHDIFIDKRGHWSFNGRLRQPADIFERIDVVVNALHGEYGEDGKIQKLLERHGVPYTGSSPFAAALAMNKPKASEMLRDAGIAIPHEIAVHQSTFGSRTVQEVFSQMPFPAVVKPATLGSSVAVYIVHSYDELARALSNVFSRSKTAVVQEYLEGREATCGVVDDFRDHELYALPVVEIRPVDAPFFDYDAKYGGGTEEIVPGNFSERERDEMQRIAKTAHEILGLRHYSRSDFIVTERRGIYLLEVNALPGMTEESLFPKSLDAVGCSMGDFLDHLIASTLQTKTLQK